MSMFGGELGGFAGIKFREYPLDLVRDVPVRKHKRRRGQSATYHRRVQKKWNKRFGMKKERYALLINPSACGLLGGPMGLLDTHSMAMLRNFRL